jgi:hypothetical protein
MFPSAPEDPMDARRHVWKLAIAGAAALAGCGGDAGPSSPAAPATGTPSAGGTVYGAPLADAQVLAIADVVARAQELDGKKVRVEGLVADVCAKRGCWFKVAEENGPAALTFKVEDGAMVFPMDAKGKWAVADGTVKRFVLTLEQTRERFAHEAEEAGRAFDPSSVKEPLVYVRLDGIGARIRDRK